MFSRQNVKLRDDAVLHDFLLVINVVQKRFSAVMRCARPRSICSHSLAGNDARQQIERKNFLRPLRVAIDIERDALPQKIRVHRLPLGVEFRRDIFWKSFWNLR
jgi:hypothetical protein